MTNDLLALGTAVAAAIVSLAALIPKLLAGFKKDKLDGVVATTQQSMVDGIKATYDSQIATITERLNVVDAKANDMEDKLRAQSVTVTRLMVLVLKLKGLLEQNSIAIPLPIQKEIDVLVNDALEKDIK